MTLPAVAIVAEGAQLPAEARPAIITSCARVLGEALCVGDDHALAPAARYLAVVVVGADGKLLVTLRSRPENSPRGDRHLVFSTGDLSTEHWNSTGLVVAALVADAEQTVKSQVKPSPPEPPRRELEKHAPRATDVWARVGVAFVASPGFDFDPWRAGPTLRVAFGFGRAVFYPALTTRWLSANGLVRSDVVSGALGVGARVIDFEDRLEFDVELAAVVDALLLSAVTQVGNERSFRIRYGARLGLSSSLRLVGSLHGFGGLDATWLGKRAILELDSRRLGAEPRFLPGFEVGLRLTF